VPKNVREQLLVLLTQFRLSPGKTDRERFGASALPGKLLVLVHPTQGHKSRANEPYVTEFVKWLEGKAWEKNKPLGQPQLKSKILSMTEEECRSSCSEQDRAEDECDEICSQ
jgi:hypothetical protein